jgi:hypothetical protein
MRYPTSPTEFFILVMLAGFLPTQGQAQQREVELRPLQVYTNVPSQFQFPPTIATFQRELTFTQYDREGRDIGIGYNDLSNSIATTTFVYPIAQRPPNDTLKGHFGTCKTEVLSRHTDAKLLSEGKVQVTPGGHKQVGEHAAFAFSDFFAHKRQAVRSELYLFTHEHMFVLFRFTYPTGQQAAAEPAIKAFIDGLAWP